MRSNSRSLLLPIHGIGGGALPAVLSLLRPGYRLHLNTFPQRVVPCRPRDVRHWHEL